MSIAIHCPESPIDQFPTQGPVCVLSNADPCPTLTAYEVGDWLCVDSGEGMKEVLLISMGQDFCTGGQLCSHPGRHASLPMNWKC